MPNNNELKVKHYKVEVIRKKDNPLKFIVGVISYAIFIWLVLLGITLLIYVGDIKIRQLKGDYSTPKYNAYVVLTGSMLPEIKIKDVVITKKVDANKLQANDVITFISSDVRLSAGINVTHRIQEKIYNEETGKYSFVTKGDNNNTRDAALAEEDNILGKVIFKIPKLGYLQDILAAKGGWVIVVIIPCLAILSYDIMKLGKKVGRKIKK